MTLNYLPPPPTSNYLDFNQKSRLIKSTRKLGQVLGTTPYLLETPAELPITLLPIGPRTNSPTPSTSSAESVKLIKRSRRQGSIFQYSPIVHSASSSASSLSLPGNVSSSSVDLPSTHSAPVSRRSKDANRPPPLVLHLNPVMVSPDDHRIRKPQLSPLPTPLAPVVDGFPMSPMTPTSNALFYRKKEVDAKRKKMNKVNRTFGENVPTELIFPAMMDSTPSLTSRPATITRNRRSMTVSGAQVWSTGTQAWVGEWNRGNIQEVQAQLRQLKAR
ncbi:hypothetical protein BDM02DRAFT_3108873 [Thelephora ganbajun]|uniref:Uncharacterized protein n=1 Tax=Thelephora ganbajun TaxID=370292 RepID=A0ACB6ZT51_THEGA|nr:hypothetical protein BDM02DRAFT_3108873 [Thelephora ganbajun]